MACAGNAAARWDAQALQQQFGMIAFTVVKPTGGAVLMSLQDYLAYCSCQHDENPLYIFDS